MIEYAGQLSLSAPVWTILATGLAFGCLEILLNVLLRPMFSSALQANPKNSPKEVQSCAPQCVTRVVSTIHNAIQIPLAIAVLLDSGLRADRLYATRPTSQLVMCISAGYFLYDLAVCLIRYNQEGPLFLLHAIVCFFVFTYGAITHTMHYHGAVYLMWEISTPFVHLRWYLYKVGLANTKLYVYNGVTMILAFFLCRNVWGTLTSILFWKDTQNALVDPLAHRLKPPIIYAYRVCNVLTNGLNTYWFAKMMQRVVELAFGNKSAADVTREKDE